MSEWVRYCPKCGNMEFSFQGSMNGGDKCRVCDHIMLIPPEDYVLTLCGEYRDGISLVNGLTFKENEKRFIEEVIKPNPEFDPKLYARKDDIIEQQENERLAVYRDVRWWENKSSNTPKCPTCGSTNIQKISVTSKAVGASLFGIFSKTARSQFKCRNCGYKW